MKIAPESNELWYTTTDGEKVEDLYLDRIGGLTIVSNEFDEDTLLFIITFSGNLISIGFEEFEADETDINTLFGESDKVKTITLPLGLLQLKSMAFYNLTSLESINLPNSLLFIGSYALYGSNLSSLYIPRNVNDIKDFAFSPSFIKSIVRFEVDSKNLKYSSGPYNNCLYDKETGYLFEGANVESIKIPKEVEFIQGNSLNYCDKLKTIDMRESSVTIIDANGISNSDNLENVYLSPVLEKINGGNFNSTKIKSITIPASVQLIGNAFLDCTVLDTVIYEGIVNKVQPGAFSGCSLLTKTVGIYTMRANIILTGVSDTTKEIYVLPETVSVIADSLFKNCTNATEFYLPQDRTVHITSNVFKTCTKLKAIYCLSLLFYRGTLFPTSQQFDIYSTSKTPWEMSVFSGPTAAVRKNITLHLNTINAVIAFSRNTWFKEFKDIVCKGWKKLTPNTISIGDTVISSIRIK